MPYKYEKQGDKYVVYKKDGGERVGSTDGNKTALNKYLASLNMHADEAEEITEGDVIETSESFMTTRAGKDGKVFDGSLNESFLNRFNQLLTR